MARNDCQSAGSIVRHSGCSWCSRLPCQWSTATTTAPGARSAMKRVESPSHEPSSITSRAAGLSSRESMRWAPSPSQPSGPAGAGTSGGDSGQAKAAARPAIPSTESLARTAAGATATFSGAASAAQ